MDTNVHDALLAAFAGYQAGTNDELVEEITLEPAAAQFHATLEQIFDKPEDFMAKLSQVDDLFDSQSEFEDIREFVFDLLMINFFTTDAARFEDDYLESPEWQQIEDDTIDRGTEILNVFLYLRECREEEIEPSLSDYLNEFLLVEDEEFQDEHEIYEDVIAHQGLMDTGYGEIADAAKSLPSQSQFKAEFYPVMAFFLNTAPEYDDMKEFLEGSEEKAFEASIYFSIIAFNDGLDALPLEISEK